MARRLIPSISRHFIIRWTRLACQHLRFFLLSISIRSRNRRAEREREMAGARGSSKRRSWLIVSICYISSSFLYIDTCRQFHYSSRVRAQQQCWPFFILVCAWLRRRSEAYCVLHSEKISVHWSKISWVDAISVLHQCVFLSSRWQDTDGVTIHCPTPSVCSLTYWHKAIGFHSARIDQLKEIEMSIKKQGFLPRHASSARLKWRGIFLEDDPKQWLAKREQREKKARVPTRNSPSTTSKRARQRFFFIFLSLFLYLLLSFDEPERERKAKRKNISPVHRAAQAFLERERERDEKEKYLDDTTSLTLPPHTHAFEEKVRVRAERQTLFFSSSSRHVNIFSFVLHKCEIDWPVADDVVFFFFVVVGSEQKEKKSQQQPPQYYY